MHVLCTKRMFMKLYTLEIKIDHIFVKSGQGVPPSQKKKHLAECHARDSNLKKKRLLTIKFEIISYYSLLKCFHSKH